MSAPSTKHAPNVANVSQVIIVDKWGGKQYCKVGKNFSNPILHRLDGPAVEYPNSYTAYYKDGLLHRDNGPAVEFAGKACSYWKNGVRVK